MQFNETRPRSRSFWIHTKAFRIANHFQNNWSIFILLFFLHSIPLPLRQSPPSGLPPLLHQQISVWESQQKMPHSTNATVAPKSAGRGDCCTQPAKTSSLAALCIICTAHPGFASPGPWNISAYPAGVDTLQLHHQTLLFYWILNMHFQSNSNEFAQGLRSVKLLIPSAAGFLNLKHLKAGDRIGAFNVRTDTHEEPAKQTWVCPILARKELYGFSPVLTITLVIMGSSILNYFLNNVYYSKFKRKNFIDPWVSSILEHLSGDKEQTTMNKNSKQEGVLRNPETSV